MSETSKKLEEFQRWMQAVITHPAGIQAGIDSDQARQQIDVASKNIERVVLRSTSQTSIERLAVYGDAYVGRLLDCMREYFPALAEMLGQELFDQFAFDYLQQYPSQSYSLGHLADNFIRYLEETQPSPEEDDSPQGVIEQEPSSSASWSDFIIDLARLELTIEKVFDGPGVEREPLFSADQLREISAEQWPEARLVPVVCLHLLKFNFPVNTYYTSYRKKEASQLPTPDKTYVAVTRRDYIVRRYDMSYTQYQLLQALMEGKSVGQAITLVADTLDDIGTFSQLLHDWFRFWTVEGFFQQVEI